MKDEGPGVILLFLSVWQPPLCQAFPASWLPPSLGRAYSSRNTHACIKSVGIVGPTPIFRISYQFRQRWESLSPSTRCYTSSSAQLAHFIRRDSSRLVCMLIPVISARGLEDVAASRWDRKLNYGCVLSGLTTIVLFQELCPNHSYQ